MNNYQSGILQSRPAQAEASYIPSMQVADKRLFPRTLYNQA